MRKNNGLNWEEKLEVKHFLEPSRLRELVEVISQDQVNEFIKSNNYGVAVLLSGNESRSKLRLAANFILSPSGVHNDDLPSIPFLIISLLEPAQLVRGVSDPHQQMLLLEASIQNILPGAQRQGQAFTIQLSRYIEQVLVNKHLADVSA